MYLYPTDKHWALDIEANGLYREVTKIHCLASVNIITEEEVFLVGEEAIYHWITERLAEGCCFIAHNGVKYDFPVKNKILKTRIPLKREIDTMLMSMFYSPSLVGGHSLEAWGKRLNMPKLDFEGPWDTYTEEMGVYCQQDARLCAAIYRHLTKRMLQVGFNEFGCEIEHRMWEIIRKQQLNGFHFNIQEAHVLYSKLKEKEAELEKEIYKYWPPVLQVVATYKRPFKKDGEPTANYLRHTEQYEKVVIRGDEYDAYDWVSFDLGSANQRREKLLGLGWKPLKSELTETGLAQPIKKGKLVPSLVKFCEENSNPQVKLLAEWLDTYYRSLMINTWITAYDDSTGCIHGTLWVANTLRYRHSNPNTANIPAVRLDKEDHPLFGEAGSYTYESRDLWTTRDVNTRCLVGVDAKGIQLRVLANYLNNKEFTDALLGGDPHSYNQEIGGFASRPIAKTFVYAFLLGAGDELVGQIIGGSTRDGRETKARFISRFPGLKGLLDDLERQVKRTGRIKLCDGTPVLVKDNHARLGYLLQGDESRIMHMAAINSYGEVARRRLDVLKVGDIHDEWQNDVLKSHSEEFAYDICPEGFKKAGEIFKYNLPIACDAKIGMTWAQTH